MRNLIKNNILKLALRLFYSNSFFRKIVLEHRGNNKFFSSSVSRMKNEEDKNKNQLFKKLNRLYRKRKYQQYIKLLNSHSLWVKEEKKSKYYSWAALIVKGSKESMCYIGEAISLHPIAINDITTSIIISEYNNKSEIENHLKRMALSSQQLTPLTFCYVLSKFDELPYLTKLIEKQYFSILLNDEEILEVYALLRDNKRVIEVFEHTKSKVFSPRSYERVYDAYTRESSFDLAEQVFDEADRLYTPLKSTISTEINPNVINNKLERHFWFAKGDLIKAYGTYKRQRLSQIMHVSFEKQYTQSLDVVSTAKNPIILASWGPGDEIRFSGLYHILNQVNPNMTISCEPRLFGLFSEMFPNIQFVPVSRVRRVDVNNAPNYDQLPNAKLHHVMDNSIYSRIDEFDNVTILTDIIGELFDRYLNETKPNCLTLSSAFVCDSIKEDIVQLKLKGKKLVGISWRSSIETASRNEHYYSMEELASIFKLDNTIFINLQYDDCSEEINGIVLGAGSEFVTLDVDQFNDFTTVLYIMQQLDMVVSAATTVLELAGLSGVKTYALSNHHALMSRVTVNNRDLWFRNIEYVENMTALNKSELVQHITEKIECDNECD
ncbi:hypothetical protein [Vibrio splendidus]|uniref:hypothetical protein n=1 Tax=Vibrio splendidus TaxID=29497 RepID=UPI000D387E60|nr:hypothetical protein [Vibrio splendidus]MCC4881512.1 hypothetical protein [Vibrio splendidus]PTO58245.1 hypothetical protein CWN96_22230 [Vibrio splendidus]PTP53371.1 hypothetical protein CWO05_12140 [Vibrio splendidus]PTP73737.1 hypothetical protein CWO06_16460 [Vibrio splendidus]PTP92683.1 hypothetical protein CWO02_12295 [Vibrio splendidus]